MTQQILLVEDNAADVYLVRQALLEHGVDHELTVTEDGDEAILMIEKGTTGQGKGRPSIVLLDLNLPRQNGLSVLKRLRENATCSDIAFVVLTSSDAKRDREDAASLGATYFRKPFELSEFLQLGALVKNLLEQRNTSHIEQ
jgi:CheY-like chemotaxis protein